MGTSAHRAGLAEANRQKNAYITVLHSTSANHNNAQQAINTSAPNDHATLHHEQRPSMPLQSSTNHQDCTPNIHLALTAMLHS